MIKHLINIFYLKYIMENIVTNDEKIAKENNFINWYFGLYVNPKYMYKNKYMLCLNPSFIRSYNKLYLKGNFMYFHNTQNYENTFINKWYYRKCDTNENLTFNHFPDDLDVAIVCSGYILNEIQNFDKYFKNFVYEICYKYTDDYDNYNYIYLIRRGEEFKSII